MEHIWRLLVGVFLLVAAIALMVLAYLFQNSVIAVIGIYGALFLFLAGIWAGIVAIIDHHNANKNEKESE